MSCYIVESSENFILITSAKKRDKVSIAITSSNFILCSLLGQTLFLTTEFPMIKNTIFNNGNNHRNKNNYSSSNKK